MDEYNPRVGRWYAPDPSNRWCNTKFHGQVFNSQLFARSILDLQVGHQYELGARKFTVLEKTYCPGDWVLLKDKQGRLAILYWPQFVQKSWLDLPADEQPGLYDDQPGHQLPVRPNLPPHPENIVTRMYLYFNTSSEAWIAVCKTGKIPIATQPELVTIFPEQVLEQPKQPDTVIRPKCSLL